MNEPVFEAIDARCLLDKYGRYLTEVHGLAANTQVKYLFIAGKMLNKLAGNGRVEKAIFTTEAIGKFLYDDIAVRSGQGAASTLSATRNFLRFLVAENKISADLVAAVPRVRTTTQGNLPERLSEIQLNKVVASTADGTAAEKRNRGVLLLLVRLGLRAQEVAALSLDDVDWTNSSILIRASKTCLERELPLMTDVAEAILRYLQHGRPEATHRKIFAQTKPPFKPLSGSAVSKIAIVLLNKSGIQCRSKGAHVFRHSVASRLVNSGSHYKDVADILGHQSLKTTAIYAKLDVLTLAKIALPWPGGER
ncbi:hypothetical protein BH10CYA1_BH10CYA1_64910 [soil metagenome]